MGYFLLSLIGFSLLKPEKIGTGGGAIYLEPHKSPGFIFNVSLESQKVGKLQIKATLNYWNLKRQIPTRRIDVNNISLDLGIRYYRPMKFPFYFGTGVGIYKVWQKDTHLPINYIENESQYGINLFSFNTGLEFLLGKIHLPSEIECGVLPWYLAYKKEGNMILHISPVGYITTNVYFNLKGNKHQEKNENN